MATGNAGMDSQLPELRARAQAARTQARLLAARNQAARRDMAETLMQIGAAWERAGRLHEARLAGSNGLLRYPRYARLRARLASMPVIEQAKGIIMAQCRCPEDAAFEALRRASQRENIKVRDLAAKVVASTAQPAPGQVSSPRRAAVPPDRFGQNHTDQQAPQGKRKRTQRRTA